MTLKSFHSREFSFGMSPLPTLMVIPSGIGCSIGGYSGDALPAARLLAAATDCLITHPNVVNGAMLYWSDPRISYVEGYSLDRFASGEIALKPVRQQRIGLLLDAAIEPDLRVRQLQAADACKATLGLNIGPVVTTDVPLGVTLSQGESGVSWGQLGHPGALLRAGQLLKEDGATAIAVVTRFPDDLDDNKVTAYRHGQGVDVLAGAEAVISHLLVRDLGIPCAHAPALPSFALDLELDPRSAGEELGYTFLSCVLVGLSRSPDLVQIHDASWLGVKNAHDILTADQIGAVVAPDGALGGEAVLACLERAVPLIAVNNPSLLSVTLDALSSKELTGMKNLFRANNYIEAAGLLMMLREGISIESLQRPISSIGLAI